MTLPASGVIYLSQVDTELGRAATASIDMNESAVRTLFSVPSGTIYMSNGYGKSAGGGTVTITVVSNIQGFNVYANRLASQHGSAVIVSGTYSSTSTINVIVNSGVVVGSNYTSLYAFDTGTGWSASNTLTLTNNGYIAGNSGLGGMGWSGDGGAGDPGGPGMNVQKAISITNANGYIYSGGGGGGGGGGNPTNYISGQPGYNGGGWLGPVQIMPSGVRNVLEAYVAPNYTLVAQAWGLNGCNAIYSGQGGGGGGPGGLGGRGGDDNGHPHWGGQGGGHGMAITGIANVTWVSGNTRVYGGTI